MDRVAPREPTETDREPGAAHELGDREVEGLRIILSGAEGIIGWADDARASGVRRTMWEGRAHEYLLPG
ncbi:hypothetical protein GCM10025760_17030 [Microbacterium yannicii]|uniref:Uncharacterized protein n=1 Tax=Microbacterium yannicii TaxID=671622 RepID=A0ABP9M723_9MICO